MSSKISFAYLVSVEGTANGLATLGTDTKIPVSQIPTEYLVETFKGTYATEEALLSAHPVGALGDYAYITATASYWYWNITLASWIDQKITVDLYNILSTDVKVVMPFIIVP